MGRLLRTKNDYEDLRNARIVQNQARLHSLGVHNTLSELHSISSSAKSQKAHVRKYCQKVYDLTSLRRSDRLKGPSTTQAITTTPNHTSSSRLTVGVNEESEEGTKRRPLNAPFVELKASKMELVSSESWSRRCDSKSRGTVYHSVFGICCHFCRQKKLCGEEDCKRCGTLDMDQPCIGKTECSVCHSTNGVLCRGCLKVRYGEEMEEVRGNKDWMCPHCIEEKGVRPYWICNSSFCMKKRKMVPTGIAIYRCQEMGYKSVAHLVMDELKRKMNRHGATK
ncbi:PREDICTED: cell division cycle-associated protein 7-like isoform X2 [Fragaria vesca subsp. vesca]|uniref:cell division cycle-associated protein 7-like isoform X2 n=1 Tax=Fragaria vesca subsp. vesca TaxID=101020 RepID=UPI0002C33952|nr:PREDICTED: cell division cycle-associated protein 7-like isoform X2 [Fragaria vesca subsp. vesca]